MLPFNIGVGGASGVDVGDIGHSLRFRGAATAYLNRTFGTPTNKSKWTLSFWIKRAELGRTQIWFGATINASANFSVQVDGSNYFLVTFTNALYMQSNEVLRDPTAWMHFVISYDSANGTAANRCRVWQNGVEITSWSVDNRASLGTANDAWNTAALAHYIGSNSVNKDDDYKARVAFVDNLAVTDATSFGYFNTQINEWVSKTQSAVKAVVDAGGTNNFMLDFDDGTSLTTLGYDKSSKGNHWTLNNFSLTAGSTYDWMLDVPGNSYATWNPLFPTTNTISNGNLRGALAASVNAGYGIRSTIPMVSGKYEAEFVPAASADSWSYVGVCPASWGISDVSIVGSNAVLYRAGNGNKNVSGVATAYGASWTTEAIRVAVDMDSRTVTFYKAGVSQGAISLPSATESYVFVMANGNATAFTADANFGQQPITLDTGFKALCQANLPDPAILNPEKHFDVKLDTGANIKTTSEAVFPSNFFEWIKDRANANNHQLIDTVRGSSAVLQSNTTAAETTYSAPSGSSVGWVWKAGGAAVTNNNGSISSQVSANVLAGQSVVTYIGNGGTATIGHGLTSAPELIHVKSRDDSIDGWYGYHASLGATKGIFLNLTSAAITSSVYWNDTAPTTSVFTVKGTGVTNRNGDDYVALCFHSVPGYSKVGSYIGNGSTDGPYVECGFKPKYVMIKAVTAGDSNSDWIIYDTVRSPYNAADYRLYANGDYAEWNSAVYGLDILSSGFKPRNGMANYGFNTSGVTYIFYAVADVASKYSLAR